MKVINSTLKKMLNFLKCEKNYGSILAMSMLYCAYGPVNYSSSKQEEKEGHFSITTVCRNTTLVLLGDLLLVSVI